MFDVIQSPREIRSNLGLNQSEFWSRIGVTQSGGSRYENGRNMPKPVRELLRLVHIEQVDLHKVNREDLDVIEYLKEMHPDLLKSLKKAVAVRNEGGSVRHDHLMGKVVPGTAHIAAPVSAGPSLLR